MLAGLFQYLLGSCRSVQAGLVHIIFNPTPIDAQVISTFYRFATFGVALGVGCTLLRPEMLVFRGVRPSTDARPLCFGVANISHVLATRILAVGFATHAHAQSHVAVLVHNNCRTLSRWPH